MITNHGYLDNPTFRGMRQSLMKTFNEIFVLDLHGNSHKKETTPGGGKDENVFDIRTGVAILLMVKRKGTSGCNVRQADLFGNRETKYTWLDDNSLKSNSFMDTHASVPWYFFAKPGIQDLSAYQEWLGINEIFPQNSVGVVTSRDDLVIDYDRNNLKNRILQLVDPTISDELLKMAFNIKENSHWDLKRARDKIKKGKKVETDIIPINYRPFDIRSIFYNEAFIERPRYEVMQHMLQGENIALISARINKSQSMNHFFITNLILEAKCGERTTQSGLFPLYLYSNDAQHNLFGGARTPNLNPGLVERLSQTYSYNPEPEEILAYIYGVFYSNLYRQKYAEALRIDFPRVPFTDDPTAFKRMADLGQRLIGLHLLKSAELNPPLGRYQGGGENNTIEKVTYEPASRRIYINGEKYFEGITAEVWNYQIGGYQVLNKYLKDRKGRVMEDPVHYVQIITALAKTIEIQKEIDLVYPEVEKNTILF